MTTIVNQIRTSEIHFPHQSVFQEYDEIMGKQKAEKAARQRIRSSGGGGGAVDQQEARV